MDIELINFKNLLLLDRVYSFDSKKTPQDRLVNIVALEKLLDPSKTYKLRDFENMLKIRDKLAKDMASSMKPGWAETLANYFGWTSLSKKKAEALKGDLERIQQVTEKLAKTIWKLETIIRESQKEIVFKAKEEIQRLQKKEIEDSQRIGLSQRELDQIQKYIDDKMPIWIEKLDNMEKKSGDSSTGFIEKKGENLPRSLIVYRNPSTKECSIAVLLKTKGGLKPLGRGAFKEVKLALDWSTKELQAQSIITLRSDQNKRTMSEEQIEKELAFQKQLSGERGVVLPAMHMIKYSKEFGANEGSSQKVVKLSMLSPLYGGNLLSIVSPTSEIQPVTAREKRIIVENCLEGLAALEKHGIVHNDLHLGNIFFKRNENGRICEAAIADFGLAEWSREREGIYQQRKYLAMCLLTLFNGPSPTEEVEKASKTIKGTVEYILWQMKKNKPISPIEALKTLRALESF